MHATWSLKQLYSLVVFVFGALLAASCASSDQGSEPIGELSQGQEQICICTKCPANDCATFTCDVAAACACVARPTRKEGEACKGPSAAGVCVSNECCEGCVSEPGRDGTRSCGAGDSPKACGTGGTACKSCDDGNECTINEYCKEGQCGSEPARDGTACTGGVCAGGACCTGCVDAQGVCRKGTGAGGCGLGGGACAVCDDKNPCSSDVCSSGRCAYPAVGDGTSCETDGNLCNGVSTCNKGECGAGTALSCDDNNACTNDACDRSAGCTHTNNTQACTDGSVCTLGDQCRNGACQPGSGRVTCEDGEPCTEDECDPSSGCVHRDRPNSEVCDDNTSCTSASECRAGKCTGTAGTIPMNCQDTNPCTQPVCTGSLCMLVNSLGTECNVNKCMTGQLCSLSGSTAICSGGTPIVCDDNNPCTRDGCEALTGCTFVNDDEAACSDGDVCTQGDHCAGGECTPETQTECAPLDDCHEPGKCDVETGTCTDRRKANGSPCDAESGRCQNGSCVTIVSEGGAGGAGSTPQGGSSTEGGSATGEGGAPNLEGGTSGSAGEGLTPGDAGGPSSGGSGPDVSGRGNKFVRDAGGCACNVPTPGTTAAGWWGAGLAFGAFAWSRRRRARTGVLPRLRR